MEKKNNAKETGNNINQYAAKFKELLTYHHKDVITYFFPQLKDKEVNFETRTTSLIEGIGNPLSAHYLVETRWNGGVYKYDARYTARPPRSYNETINHVKKDYLGCQFLSSLENLNSPDALILDDAPDWKFTKHIEGKTLDEILKEERKETQWGDMNRVIDVCAKFQVEATEKANSLTSQKKNVIFYQRTIEQQARKYLQAASGEKDVEEDLKIYMRLFGRHLEGNFVCHGDFSTSNIVGENGKLDRIYVIDSKLRLRDEFSDLGSLISFIGNQEDCWDSYAENFKISKAAYSLFKQGVEVKTLADLLFENKKLEQPEPVLTTIPDEKSKEKLKNIFEKNGKKFDEKLFSLFRQIFQVRDNAISVVYRGIRNNIVHSSLRLIEKWIVREENPLVYKLQRQNVFTVLDRFIENPNIFGLSSQDVDDSKKLRERFSKYKNLTKIEDSSPQSAPESTLEFTLESAPELIKTEEAPPQSAPESTLEAIHKSIPGSNFESILESLCQATPESARQLIPGLNPKLAPEPTENLLQNTIPVQQYLKIRSKDI